MAIFLLILKIIGISLLAIIGLVLLVLCMPLFVYIKFEKELMIDVRFLFVKFNVHPSHKDEEKAEGKGNLFSRLWKKITGKSSDDKEAEIKEEKEKESKFKALFGERGASGAISFLWEILTLVFGRSVKILRGIVVSKFNLKIEIVGDDASDTALRYGKLCGVVYPALSLIFQNVKKYKHEIDMRPNFENKYEYDQVSLDTKLRILPISAGYHALAVLLSILMSEIKRQVAEKRSAADEKTN